MFVIYDSDGNVYAVTKEEELAKKYFKKYGWMYEAINVLESK